jgi:hypothetical protein
MGVKAGNKYIGYTFSGLWVIGLISGILLASSIKKDFVVKVRDRKESTLIQPSNGKLLVRLKEANITRSFGPGIKMDGLVRLAGDSIQMSNIKLRIEKSSDSLYHLNSTRISYGKNDDKDSSSLSSMQFGLEQKDSVLLLDRGIILPPGAKFRNQQMILTLQVPVGNKVVVDRSVKRKYFFFHISELNKGDEWEEEDKDENWRSGVEYIMTEKGLIKTGNVIEEKSWEDIDEEDFSSPDSRKSRRQLERELEKKNRELERLKEEQEGVGEAQKVTLSKDKEQVSFFARMTAAWQRVVQVPTERATATALMFAHKMI